MFRSGKFGAKSEPLEPILKTSSPRQALTLAGTAVLGDGTVKGASRGLAMRGVNAPISNQPLKPLTPLASGLQRPLGPTIRRNPSNITSKSGDFSKGVAFQDSAFLRIGGREQTGLKSPGSLRTQPGEGMNVGPGKCGKQQVRFEEAKCSIYNRDPSFVHEAPWLKARVCVQNLQEEPRITGLPLMALLDCEKALEDTFETEAHFSFFLNPKCPTQRSSALPESERSALQNLSAAHMILSQPKNLYLPVQPKKNEQQQQQQPFQQEKQQQQQQKEKQQQQVCVCERECVWARVRAHAVWVWV